MSWAGKSHPIEVAASWGAPLLLAAASGWSAWLAGLGTMAIGAATVIGLAVGAGAMRLAGGVQAIGIADFEPVELDQGGDVLLLDDPLIEVDPASRVVQLFAHQEPTPGELVLRISDYLIENGRDPVLAGTAVEPPPDASAALHAALANIRLSLR